MLQFLYSQCFRLLLPFVLIRLWWQSRRHPGAGSNWLQRLGYVDVGVEPVVWVHAVSVGETIAAGPLIKSLLERQPGIRILLTAMTATGAEQARAMFGDRVCYAYSPYDTPGAVKRFVRRIRPRALVIMETELWPNMIREVSTRQCPIFLVNARLSERSANGYRRVGSWVRSMLNQIDWIAAQADEDAARFRRLGARAGAVSVTGSIKFDVSIPEKVRQQSAVLRTELDGRPVWIAASTHEGEDEQLLEAHRKVLDRIPDALLLIVPRHPERFDSVASLALKNGFSLARRSLDDSVSEAEVYLGDTMGELLMLYGACDVAFVGGSLIERGGHNPLEPAAWGVPVITGTHVFNFETIYQQLEAGDGLVRVSGSDELAGALGSLLSDSAQRSALGGAARKVVEANRGALNQVVEGVLERLAPVGDEAADQVRA
ncbi:lipid IV(A) 3-deoxy-D-manno-octulosonic acid transferase [Marinobacter bryozoorum]|uniref:lipid IV(A) 3-deoxy-D-manno-octulosonic acid transferase n=1 Tax=Marinobacter bryozoorum TaxID=256324 RepID=UPI0020042D6E|nr:lipid IV(A) 3-deoxy-D-manno-octulosonic acid transferase [Marinobacter bryozoorum]MCK7544763.1 lipid IV(A) 3-deoxy-D-manno-octulosonic acid transferase [Marinobacter bryozoorum]